MEWLMVANTTGRALFVTSQYSVILTYGVGLAKSVDTVCVWFYTHSPYLSLKPTMCHRNLKPTMCHIEAYNVSHKLICAPSYETRAKHSTQR